MCLCAATPIWPAELDGNALIRRLARPAPASISFTEIRFSSLLDQPLVVSGELGYLGPERLDRVVTDPYREKTTIRGESVRVEREGESPRTFALKRAPELRGLLTAFSALLAGDPSAVARNFSVTAEGEGSVWQLTLTPTDARARKRLRELTMNGQGDEPLCFTVTSADGSQSIMLLSGQAREGLKAAISPERSAERFEEQLALRCKPRALQ
jgi:hypothetical protein